MKNMIFYGFLKFFMGVYILKNLMIFLRFFLIFILFF